MSSSLLHTQGKVAKIFAVTKETVLDWEREGILKLHSIHAKTKARLYHETDVIALLATTPTSNKIYKCSNYSMCKTVLGFDNNPPIIVVVSFTESSKNCNHVKRDNTFCYACKNIIAKRVYCEKCAAKFEQQTGKPLIIAENPPINLGPSIIKKREKHMALKIKNIKDLQPFFEITLLENLSL